MLHDFEYAAPRGRAELLDLLAERGDEAKLLAGGTDLLPGIRAGLAKPALVLDLKRVADYVGLAWSDVEGLVIGPTATINDILRETRITQEYPLLAACASDLASHQVRNRATVAGNIVNASPCSDMAPALLCLDARVVLASRRSEREIALREFFTGVKRTVMRSDEILERIIVPAEMARARGSYRKLKRIKGHDLGIVGVALMKKDGLARIGLSSVAPTPLLVEGLREADSPDDLVAAVMRAIRPISDLRCTKEYRAFMIEAFTRRLAEEVA